MTMNSAFVLPVAAAGIATVSLWHYATRPPTAHVLAGVDSSLSVKANCSGLAGALQSSLHRPGIREGSTLTLMAMGKAANDPEPNVVFRDKVPIPSDDAQGRKAKERQYAEKRNTFLAELALACNQIAAAPYTPLYRLVLQGLADLKAAGACPPQGRCLFLVKTDLIEDVDPLLTALLGQAAEDPTVPVPAELAASLDNTGVEIVFCGTSEIRPGKRTAKSASLDTRQRIWRELFVDRASVSFQPFCRAFDAPQ